MTSRAPGPGDKLHIHGGYSYRPSYLQQDPRGYTAEVVKYIPDQNHKQALVVKLDQPLTCKGYTGSYIVLQLRYQDGDWSDEAVVHLELCDFEPPDIEWATREQGQWIESAASYQLVVLAT
jgi:hypothetical protein